MKKLIIPLMIIFLVSLVSATITNVVPQLGYNQVMINWSTDVNNTGSIQYGIGVLQSSVGETMSTNAHGLVITGLLPETTYVYKLISGVDNYPATGVLNFTTQAGGQVNQGLVDYDLDDISPTSGNKSIIISGSTDSMVRISRNLNGIWYNQEMTLIDNSKTFIYDSVGNFSLNISLQEGDNNLRIEFIDSESGNREIVEFSVYGDFQAPSLQLFPVPSFTKGEIQLIGLTEVNATVKVFVDNTLTDTMILRPIDTNLSNFFKAKGFITEGNNFFNKSIRVSGGDGEHNISFELKDKVGNVNKAVFKTTLDSESPELFNVSIVSISRSIISTGVGHTSGLWTPYNPVVLNGIATDNLGNNTVKTIILNIRNYTNCNDYKTKLEEEMSDVNYFNNLEDTVPGFEASIETSFNVVGSLFGNSASTVNPKSNGDFETTINLMSPNVLKNETVKDNNICIFVVDRAGNIAEHSDTITYEPTSSVWGINGLESDPNEIYSSWLKHNSYPVALMFDLVFHDGRDFEKVDDLKLRVTPIDDGLDQIGKVIRAAMQSANVISVKDESIKGYHIYIPYEIGQQMDANTLLYEQDSMQFSFRLEIDYKYNNVPQSQQLQFAQAKFSVETPYDVSKFLTPELVNGTLIPFFNDTRKFVSKMSNFTRDKLIQPALPICTGLMVLNTMSTFFGGGSSLVIPMKLVCDRVFSPVVPPKGPMFDQNNLPTSNTDLITGTAGTQANSASRDYIGGATNNAGGTVSGYLTEGHGVYRKGTIFSPKNVPCQPVIFDSVTGKAQSAVLGSVTSISETSVYTVKDVATGVATNRCYSDAAPFYDKYKCIPKMWMGKPEMYDLNPMHDLFDSIQCGSFSGFYLQTQKVVRHLDKILDCLNSIEEGLLDAGYCEQILSTSACELFTYAFEKVVGGATNGKGFGPKDGVGKLQFQDMMQSYEQAVTRVVASEGESGNYLHSMCMMAFGADASNFDTFLDNFLAAQDRRPTIGPVFVQSQMNSYDEITGQLQIQYKYSPYIMAGKGSDVSATLVLYCAPGTGSEYCPQGEAVSLTIPLGTIAKGTTLSDTKVYNDIGAKVWYNKAKIEYSFDDVVSSDSTQTKVTCETEESDLANFCRTNGGAIISASDKCNGGKGCRVSSIVTSTASANVKQTTEPKDIIQRGGIRFSCTFDVNTYGGFHCGYGTPTSNSAQLEFMEAFLGSSTGYNPNNNIDVFLKLDKHNYGKQDFIVRYEIKNVLAATVVKTGAKTFSTADAFKCQTSGVTGTQPKQIIPLRIVDAVGTVDEFNVYGQKQHLNTLPFTLDMGLKFNFVGTEGGSATKKDITLKKIIITNEKNEKISCDFLKEIVIPRGTSDILSFKDLIETAIKGGCQKTDFYDYTLPPVISIDKVKFNEIKELEIQIVKKNKDLSYEVEIFKNSEKQFSFSLDSGGSTSAEGKYEVNLELFYCKNSDVGSCGSVTQIDDPSGSTYGKIVYSDESNAGQKKTLTYSIIKREGCSNGPEIKILNPLERIYISNVIPAGKEITLSIFDDCDEVKTVTTKIMNGESIDTTNIKKEGNIYKFNIPKEKITGFEDGYEFTLQVQAKDNSDHQGALVTIPYVVSTQDNKAHECSVSGLQGTGQ